MPLNGKSQALVNSWAGLFAEYLDRAANYEKIDPWFGEAQGDYTSGKNIIAARSHRVMFRETARLKKILGLENSDLLEALEPAIKYPSFMKPEDRKRGFSELSKGFAAELAFPRGFDPDFGGDYRPARIHSDHLNAKREKEEEEKRFALEAHFLELAITARESVAPSAERAKTPLNEKSQQLVNTWAGLFTEYFDRAGISEPMHPLHDSEYLQPSYQNEIAVRSRGEILNQTVRLKKAFNLEDADLEEALGATLKERFEPIRENPRAYLPMMWVEFEEGLAKPFSTTKKQRRDPDRELLSFLGKDSEYHALEKAEEKKRLELEASFAEVAKAAEKAAALSSVSEEGKRPGQTPEKELGGQAPEQSR